MFGNQTRLRSEPSYTGDRVGSWAQKGSCGAESGLAATLSKMSPGVCVSGDFCLSKEPKWCGEPEQVSGNSVNWPCCFPHWAFATAVVSTSSVLPSDVHMPPQCSSFPFQSLCHLHMHAFPNPTTEIKLRKPCLVISKSLSLSYHQHC